MATKLTQPATAATNMTLTPVMTLESQEDSSWIWSMAYFPDGKRMISVFVDQTMRRWDLQAGKEIEPDVRDVCDGNLYVVVVSRDGRWVITSGGGEEHNELKAYEVETGIVKTFQGSRMLHKYLRGQQAPGEWVDGYSADMGNGHWQARSWSIREW
jgi:WD40 repeat protein